MFTEPIIKRIQIGGIRLTNRLYYIYTRVFKSIFRVIRHTWKPNHQAKIGYKANEEIGIFPKVANLQLATVKGSITPRCVPVMEGMINEEE